jgi:hypothetical protein
VAELPLLLLLPAVAEDPSNAFILGFTGGSAGGVLLAVALLRTAARESLAPIVNARFCCGGVLFADVGPLVVAVVGFFGPPREGAATTDFLARPADVAGTLLLLADGPSRGTRLPPEEAVDALVAAFDDGAPPTVRCCTPKVSVELPRAATRDCMCGTSLLFFQKGLTRDKDIQEINASVSLITTHDARGRRSLLRVPLSVSHVSSSIFVCHYP